MTRLWLLIFAYLMLPIGSVVAQSFTSGAAILRVPSLTDIQLDNTTFSVPFSGGIIANLTPVCGANPCPPTNWGSIVLTQCDGTDVDNGLFTLYTTGRGYTALGPAGAQLIGYITGTTLTVVTSYFFGGSGSLVPIAIGDTVKNQFSAASNPTYYTDVQPGTTITAFGTGAGANGTYTVTPSQNVPIEGLMYMTTLNTARTYHIGLGIGMEGTANGYICVHKTLTGN